MDSLVLPFKNSHGNINTLVQQVLFQVIGAFHIKVYMNAALEMLTDSTNGSMQMAVAVANDIVDDAYG